MGQTNSIANTSPLNRSETLNGGELVNRKSSSRNLASTIRKRFSKKTRRFLKQPDYNKMLREFLSSWSSDNLVQLVHDYEKSSIIKDFYLQAELAKPTVANVSQDLRKIYDTSDCADVYLEFKEQKFPVHKSIVCARCPLFRELLGKIYAYRIVVPIQIEIPEITTDLFSNLLRYLYSGEMSAYSNDEKIENEDYKNLFENLSKHVPNDLEFDLRHLLNTGIYSDVKLVFKNSNSSSSNITNYNANKINETKHNSSNNLTYNLNASNSTRNLTYNSTTFTLNQTPTKSNKQSQCNSGSTNDTKCLACSTQSEYSCHAAVLASRSRFFRNLILKYQAKNCSNSESSNVNISKQIIRIVLDEEYIKKRYISVVLNVIYCDGANILNLLSNCVCKCKSTNSLSNLSSNSTNLDGSQEANNLNSSTANSTTSSGLFNTQTIFQTISNSISSNEHTNSIIKPDNFIDEIFDLFVIGKFLELEILISVCENLLIDAINLDTVFRILDWSEKSSGSEFVRRQCLCFLREEFSTISISRHLLRKLNENQLIELISSDFLQASEDEVLRAILKWTKIEMSKEMIRPNNSNSEECSEKRTQMIARLIKHLRTAHILPLESDVLKNALKNELNEFISVLPTYILNDQTLSYQIMAWINLENRSNFIKPRFFQPFYEEARALLDERMIRCEEMNINSNEKVTPRKSSFNTFVSPILTDSKQVAFASFNKPDNLYMVDDNLSNSLGRINFNKLNCSNNKSNNVNDLDLNADRTMIKSLKEKFLVNKLQIDLDYLDKETKNLIRLKSTEYYLKVLPALKTLNLEEKYQILIYIQLKILREHNLPDEMLFIFEKDEPDYASREKVCLDMNLKRRSLNKNRKFSINSLDLDNYLLYDSVAEENHLDVIQQDDTFNQNEISNPLDDSNKFNRSDLQNFDLPTFDQQTDLQISHQPDQSVEQNLSNQFDYSQEENILTNQLDNLSQYSTFDGSEIGLPEQEISVDVFI